MTRSRKAACRSRSSPKTSVIRRFSASAVIIAASDPRLPSRRPQRANALALEVIEPRTPQTPAPSSVDERITAALTDVNRPPSRRSALAGLRAYRRRQGTAGVHHSGPSLIALPRPSIARNSRTHQREVRSSNPFCSARAQLIETLCDADSRRIEYVERGELATVKVAELRLRKARIQLATS
jgi:hypothetical protein